MTELRHLPQVGVARRNLVKVSDLPHILVRFADLTAVVCTLLGGLAVSVVLC